MAQQFGGGVERQWHTDRAPRAPSLAVAHDEAAADGVVGFGVCRPVEEGGEGQPVGVGRQRDVGVEDKVVGLV